MNFQKSSKSCFFDFNLRGADPQCGHCRLLGWPPRRPLSATVNFVPLCPGIWLNWLNSLFLGWWVMDSYIISNQLVGTWASSLQHGYFPLNHDGWRSAWHLISNEGCAIKLCITTFHTRQSPPTEDAFRTLTAPFAAIALLVMMIHQIGDSSATVS